MLEFQIHWHDRLPSTNTYLKDWARENPNLPEGTLVAARQQDAGRGRRGRTWQSAPDRDLAFSLLLRPSVPPARIPSLPLLASLAVAEAMDYYGLTAGVKWPNDVRIEGRKIAGILVEAVAGNPHTYVVGIGVNVNSTVCELADVGQPATSIAAHCGGGHSLDILLRRILGSFDHRYPAWVRDGFLAIRYDWIARAEPPGRPVILRDGETPVRGTLEGYGEDGTLVLRLDDDSRRVVFAGDIDPAG